MAITASLGNKTNNTTAGTSLSINIGTAIAGQDIVVGVAILTTTSTVSTVTDSYSNTYTLKSAVNNGTAVRVELWEAHNITGGSGNTVAVTLSAASLGSMAVEMYAGASSGVGHIGTTTTGTSNYPEGDVATQDGNNWGVAAVAVATSSGDTFSTDLGTIRQSVVPSLTTASIALIDSFACPLATLRCGPLLSASRAWAVATIELRTGGAAGTVGATNVSAPIRRAILTGASSGGSHTFLG